MEDYRTIIGENIRRHRKRHCLTQEDLAELTGIQPSSVGKIERAQSNPNLTTLLRYANALKIDLPALFIDPNSEKINDCVPNIPLSALPEPNRSAARLLLQVLNDIVNTELDESYVSSLFLEILRLVRHSVFEVTSSSCGRKRTVECRFME
ncbi:MAG: helix-turn-helix domain-containing protein [Anaeromassilibacillus sp.]